MEKDEDMYMAAPRFRWEWNVNTVAVLVGFCAGFIAWGYTLAELRTGREINATNIERLSARVSALEVSARILDNHELRIASVEAQARDAAAAMRTVEAALNSLASDIRVTREIVQRIEQAQRGGRGVPQDQR